MKHPRLHWLLCLLVCLTAAAADYIIDAPAALDAGGQVACIELSGEVLYMLGGRTPELRLFDKNGRAVPWALASPQRPHYITTREQVPLAIKQVRHLPDGQLEILCETDETRVLSDKVTLTFRTHVKDFEQTVLIYGTSPDSSQEQLLLEDGFIFDSSSNLTVRNLEVEFRPDSARKFRIVLQAATLERLSELRAVRTQNSSDGKRSEETERTVTEQAFKLDTLELTTYATRFDYTETVMQRYPCRVTAETPQPGDSRRTRLLVIPPVYPVNGLFIHCSEANYMRKVHLFHVAENGSGEVLLQSNTTLFRISIGRHESQESLLVQPSPPGKFILEFENGDNAPLHVTEVEAQFPVYQMRFLASPELFPLKLTSDPGGTMPKYDIAALLAHAPPEEDDLVIRPGKASGGSPPEPARRPFHWPLSLLWLGVLLAVAAMGAALYSTVRKS